MVTVAELVEIPKSLIDNFGEAQAAHDAFKPTEALYQKLSGELKALVASSPATETFVRSGDRYSLDITAQSFESVVNMAKARKKLGAVNFLAAVSVTLKALARFLTQPEVDALVTKEQIGHRKYVAAKLPDPA